jgi:hypothetical protein
MKEYKLIEMMDNAQMLIRRDSKAESRARTPNAKDGRRNRNNTAKWR